LLNISTNNPLRSEGVATVTSIQGAFQVSACARSTSTRVNTCLHQAGRRDAAEAQHVGCQRLRKTLNTKCHEMDLESSSGARNTTKMRSKTKPAQLEGSRGPDLDPIFSKVTSGNLPLKRHRPPPVSGPYGGPIESIVKRLGGIVKRPGKLPVT
jgi:hypothetical protein